MGSIGQAQGPAPTAKGKKNKSLSAAHQPDRAGTERGVTDGTTAVKIDAPCKADGAILRPRPDNRCFGIRKRLLVDRRSLRPFVAAASIFRVHSILSTEASDFHPSAAMYQSSHFINGWQSPTIVSCICNIFETLHRLVPCIFFYFAIFTVNARQTFQAAFPHQTGLRVGDCAIAMINILLDCSASLRAGICIDRWRRYGQRRQFWQRQGLSQPIGN